MPKKLRTPIIMPRMQGGTFYTFGSAMEDIGLNINENHNSVEISHYVLLNIPNFSNGVTPEGVYLSLESEQNYDGDKYTVDSSTQGDFIFADHFQNYCLNFETVLRNQESYNYASNKTVSERVFWKWLFSHLENESQRFEKDGDYYYEKKDKAIAKAFGAISAGSQRTDDSGLYNETFVQIPSSYGQMRVLFKKMIDENYIEQTYTGTNTKHMIENIDESELTNAGKSEIITFGVTDDNFSYPGYGDNIIEGNTGTRLMVISSDKPKYEITCKFLDPIVTLPENGYLVIDGEDHTYSGYSYNTGKVLKSTGISPIAKSDNDNSSEPSYIVSSGKIYDKFEVEFNITKLREYYDNNSSITYDDIGMGKVTRNGVQLDGMSDFSFNAILIYYSIYDANKTKRLATNAYGVYILDGAIESSDIKGVFSFPDIRKAKSEPGKKNGSSYSFRINVKPSTAYSGDIFVTDNSTAGYSMAEDFNDVLRNLTAAITTLKENSKVLYSVSKNNNEMKTLVENTMEKINDIETDIKNIKNGNFPYTADAIFKEEESVGNALSASIARSVLNAINVTFNTSTGDLGVELNTTGLSGTALVIAKALRKNIQDNNHLNIINMVALLVARTSGVSATMSKKIEYIANAFDKRDPTIIRMD